MDQTLSDYLIILSMEKRSAQIFEIFKDQEQLPSRCFFRLDVVSFDAEISFVAGWRCTVLMLRPFYKNTLKQSWFKHLIQHLPTLPKQLPSGLLTMILLRLIGQPTCLTWTPSGIYGIFSRERWETVDPTIQTSWRLHSVSAVLQADISLLTDAGICVKEAPTKGQKLSIACIKEDSLKNLNYYFERLDFLLSGAVSSNRQN